MKRTHVGWLLIVLMALCVAGGVAFGVAHEITAWAFGFLAMVVMFILLDEVAF